MACLSNYTLTGISLDCEANLAGIKELYLGYFGDFDVTVTEDTHSVSAMTAVSGVTNPELYKYTFAKQTGSMTSTLTKDEANGTRYYTTEIGLSFNKMEGGKHMEIEALAAEGLVAIVKDNNGKCWFVGLDSYVSGTAATAQSGASFDDKNGYDLTLTAMSAHLPYEIAENIFSSFIHIG